jgi:hypothetical protein
MDQSMKPVILFRVDRDNQEEYEIAKKYLPVIKQRTEAIPYTLTIGRYSVLPYYRELEIDLAKNLTKLVNSYREHAWVAEFEYYEALKNYTFETWHERDFYLCQYPGPFVVKGRTNSRKHQWNKKMFAADKKAAANIASDLVADDHLIAQQGVIFRKYVPLERIGEGLHGLPYANEWRFFYYGTQRLVHGFYWSIADDPSLGKMDKDGLDFADEVAIIASQFVNFFVLDIARTLEGNWILVEVNDGQMSGPSMCDLDELYSNLAKITTK